IYNQYARQIVILIQQNSGTEDDGYDILQESLVDIYHMARDRDFQLTTSFGSFLALVCKRNWPNVLKKNQRMQETKSTADLLHIEDPSETQWEEILQEVGREHTVRELLGTCGQRGQEIIKRCMVERHQEKIEESLGISDAYLRKKKSECMAALVQKIKISGWFK